MTTEDARRRYQRAAQALAIGEAAGVSAPVLDALMMNAADWWARYATIAGAQSPATVSAR